MFIKSRQNHKIEFSKDEKSERLFVLDCPADTSYPELFDTGNALMNEAWKQMEDMKKRNDEALKKKEPKVEEVKEEPAKS